MKKLLLSFTIKKFISIFFALYTSISYAKTHIVPVGQWEIDGKALGIQPGDTMCLDSVSTYSAMLWKNINGTVDKPILITNCGGQARILSTGSYGWKFQDSNYFKISGDGSPDYEYGIKVSTSTGFYLSLEKFSNNFEVSHVEIAGLYENGTHENSGFAGIGIKTKPYCDGSSNRGVWDMTNISVHDNYIHDVGGEGLYIGHGFYLGRVEAACKVGDEESWVTTYSHSIKGLRVFNNLIENIGYDGIQIKNADEDAQVYNNTVKNYGTVDTFTDGEKGAHNEGIFIGNGTEALVYNNWVEKGSGHGMQIYGFGNTKIFNNVVINSGDNGLYLNNRSKTIASKEGVFEIYNNTFVGIGDTAIKVYPNSIEERGPLQTVEIKNNIFADYINKSAGSAEYQANIFALTVEELAFENPEDQNYNLTSFSPAINNGAGVNLDFDFDYSSRLHDSIDIGAYNYSEISLNIVNPYSDVNVSSNDSVFIEVELLDLDNKIEKVKYILNGKTIGSDMLPKATEHTIGKRKLVEGRNEFYAQAITEEGDVIYSKSINIFVD